MPVPQTCRFPCHGSRPRLRGRLRHEARSGEQKNERHEQRENAERLRHGEAEDQAAELAISGRGVAQRSRKIAAEEMAETDAGAAHSKAGDACAYKLCCFWIHLELLRGLACRMVRIAAETRLKSR